MLIILCRNSCCASALLLGLTRQVVAEHLYKCWLDTTPTAEELRERAGPALDSGVFSGITAQIAGPQWERREGHLVSGNQLPGGEGQHDRKYCLRVELWETGKKEDPSKPAVESGSSGAI